MGVYEMLNYLNETYNGSLKNMLTNSAYYCYTLKDTETGKYYSGSRGVEGSPQCDLLTKYFTSSSVVDFKSKLKLSPEVFQFSVEYFSSRAAAFLAEQVFHKTHRVGKNPVFINSSDAGGSNCGAGSVLCKDVEGTTYRVSVDEFSTGKHVHVSHGMMNIRTDTGIKKILKTEFDPNWHVTEFQNYVLAIDTHTNKSCKIHKDQFVSNDKYVGITKGMVVARDTVTGQTASITKDQFASDARYVGNTFGLVPVIEKSSGLKKLIQKQDYDKTIYKHHNSNNIVVYSLVDRRTVAISKDEYAKNINNYANTTTKCFFKVDGQFFKSKKDLDLYYRKTRNKSLLKVSQFNVSTKFKDIETITQEEHKNGKN